MSHKPITSHELVTKLQLEAWNSSFELSKLRKDKARLDWLLNEDSGVNIEWIYRKDSKLRIQRFDDREDIDKAMGEL